MKLHTKLLGLAALSVLAAGAVVGNTYAASMSLEERAKASGFNDVELYDCIETRARGVLVKTDDEPLTDEELSQIKSEGTARTVLGDFKNAINCPGKNIKDYRGVEKLTGIDVFIVNVYSDTDLSAFKNATFEKLVLYIGDNISSIDLSNSKIKKLEVLDGYRYQSVQDHDFTIGEINLSGSNLKELTTMYTKTSAISLDGLDLTSLRISDFGLDDIDVSSQKNLELLSVQPKGGHQPIIDITGLTKLNTLSYSYDQNIGPVGSFLIRLEPVTKEGNKRVYNLADYECVKDIKTIEGVVFDETAKTLTINDITKNQIIPINYIMPFYYDDNYQIVYIEDQPESERVYEASIYIRDLITGSTVDEDKNPINPVFDVTKDEVLSYHIDTDFSYFTESSEVKIDDVVLDKKYYTVKEGSILLDISRDYLSTLDNGNHTLSVSLANGDFISDFEVTGTLPSVPNTGLFGTIEQFMKESVAKYIIIALGILTTIILAISMHRSHTLKRRWK